MKTSWSIQTMSNAKKLILSATLGLLVVAAMALCACSSQSGDEGGSPQSADVATVRIGTMPTEDFLPMWVAESEGLFADAGVNAELVVFDSAQNLSAALTAGQVDMAMTDPMRAIKLCESGTSVNMEWITLGTDASQGRFGVLAPADAPYNSLQELQAYCATASFAQPTGVGLAANTVPEYVYDKLCQQAGVDPASIPTQEVPSLPDRYSLVASGSGGLLGAALPGSMLALGEASGLKLLADDSTGDNISQSVMVARTAFAQDNADAIACVRVAWDAAANKINANPESYRQMLIDNANLNSTVAQSYPISTYPLATTSQGTSAYPPANLIDPVIDWMVQKGYTKSPEVVYSEADGSVVFG